VKSISVVTCSKDRNEYLVKNFSSTKNISNLKEHIHIDFSSNLNTKNLYKTNDKLKIIHIRNENEWWLTRAFNAGFHYASGDYILRLNADAELNFEEFNKINLENISYINFRFGTNDFGNILCKTSVLEKINGYNEFIFGWGYDDLDIHNRIIANNEINTKILDGNKYIKTQYHENFKRVSNRNSENKNWADAYLLANHKKNRYISQNIFWNDTFKLNYKKNDKTCTIEHQYKLNKYHFFKHLISKAIFMTTFLNELYRKSFFNKIRLIFFAFPCKLFEKIYKVKILP